MSRMNMNDDHILESAKKKNNKIKSLTNRTFFKTIKNALVIYI